MILQLNYGIQKSEIIAKNSVILNKPGQNVALIRIFA